MSFLRTKRSRAALGRKHAKTMRRSDLQAPIQQLDPV
jgi:hypothetical protein